jgi:FkbM family methyltransferase
MNISLYNVAERGKLVRTLVHEAYTLKDKITILSYYMRIDLFLINRLRRKSPSPILKSNVTIKNKYGIFFCGNNKYSVFGFSSLNESSIRGRPWIQEGLAIDIGANGGMHTVPLARALKNRGEVISIEPEPKNFSILKKNILLNKLKNVIPLNLACSDSEGESTFYLDRSGDGGHSLIKETPIKKSGEIKVKTDRLDNIIKILNIKRVDLIKIDVEGAESLVLKGAKKTLRKFHPKIIFEAWDEDYLNKSRKVLEPLGYKIKKVSDENYLAEV